MHGLINRAIEAFLKDSYGQRVWNEVALASGLNQLVDGDGFEAMQIYEDSVTFSVLENATKVLERQSSSLLEDLGTYLISNQNLEPIRRLLRFGGVSFTDFLYSLDDLQGRCKLAVPELDLPEFVIEECAPEKYALTCVECPEGFGHVVVGLLRTLADDYGALAVLEHQGRTEDNLHEKIAIELYDPAYHSGRRFDLTQEVA